MGKRAEEQQTRSSGLNDFKQVAPLGEGAYSSVYKVVRLADKAIYALKKVKLPSLSDKEKQNALNEVRLLASVRHENVIAYKEAFWDDRTKSLCIVMEFSDHGDLFQQIVKHQRNKTHFREEDVWRYLIGMCSGLKALHDMRVLHRDLKCANVFLSTGEGGRTHAKLGDFNVSKVAKRGLCMTQTGTPYYASPEVWRDMPYDAKSDMWSLGCVLYEVASLRPPFRAEDMEALYKKVLRGQYPRIPAIYSQDLADVIASLLQVNPRHRPSVDELMESPIFRRKQQELQEQLKTVPQGQVLEEIGKCDLLRTIPLPRDAGGLVASLPEPRYDPIYEPQKDNPENAERNVRDSRDRDLPTTAGSFSSDQQRQINSRSVNRSPALDEYDERGHRQEERHHQRDHRTPQPQRAEQVRRELDPPRELPGAPQPRAPRQRPQQGRHDVRHRSELREERPRQNDISRGPPPAAYGLPPAPGVRRGSSGSQESGMSMPVPRDRDIQNNGRYALPDIPKGGADSPLQLPPLLNSQAHRQRRPPPPSGGSRVGGPPGQVSRIPGGSTRLPSIGTGSRRV